MVNERGGEAVGVVATNREPAAALGAIRRKSPDHCMAARRDSGRHRGRVGRLVGGLGQEMEHGPVVPQIKQGWGLPLRHIRDQPGDSGGSLSKALARTV